MAEDWVGGGTIVFFNFLKNLINHTSFALIRNQPTELS
jgi:hypothetical protein